MFFSKPGQYEACGIFNIRHFMFALVTLIIIGVAVKYTKVKKKENIKKIIRIFTIIVWILEILKISFLFSIGLGGAVNRVVPLYFCSLLLYCGLLSSCGKGVLERSGNVFLATGGIFAGLVFIMFPSTSLPEYPLFHFISIHSFFFHGTMVYLGLIINKFKYIDIKISDLKYYASLILLICIGALIVNLKTGSNLMFISRNFPGMPISILYNSTGVLFTPIMIIIQMTLPFLIVYGIIRCIEKFNNLLIKN